MKTENPHVDTLTVLSLCSGGGGLDVGLNLALPSTRTICWVEWEAFAAAYLVDQMHANVVDEAPLWSDIHTFDGRPWRGAVDIVTAGYPCQPFSHAGSRGGTDDSRHLWPEVHRIIQEVCPTIVFLENVAGHVSLGLGTVLGDLHASGYRVAATLITASDVGASHQRERLFILGVADATGDHRGTGEHGAQAGIGANRKRERRPTSGECPLADTEPSRCPPSNGPALDPNQEPATGSRPMADTGCESPERRGKPRTMGCAESPSCPEGPESDAGRPQTRHRGPTGSLAHPDSGGRLGSGEPEHGGEQGEPRREPDRFGPDGGLDLGTGREPESLPLWPPPPNAQEQWRIVLNHHPHLAPATIVGDTGSTGHQGGERLGQHAGETRERPPRISGSACEPSRDGELADRLHACRADKQAETKSEVRGVAHGLAPDWPRRDMLRLLGNGVIPVQAAYAFTLLAARLLVAEESP